MQRTAEQLREDALAIWRAGVAAVDSRQLMRQQLRIEDDELLVGEERIALRGAERVAVVGAGKAGAGMAAAVEEAFARRAPAGLELCGWVNVPADCAEALDHITLHAARPAGVNEPTEAGVAGTQRILELVASLQPSDLCICLLSGGGSALLPAPVEGITLADKQAVTKHLSEAGANILQLNTVRKQLSRVKGGGLARACRAGRLITLIISDVLGDPLDVIASGPTVPDTATAADALDVLAQFGGRGSPLPAAVFDLLEQKAQAPAAPPASIACQVTNLVIANNAAAVDAAGSEAERRGYAHAMMAAVVPEGLADDVGRHLADMAVVMRKRVGNSDCLITGGEPVVKLAPPAVRGRGGRNQQLVLAALAHLLDTHNSDLQGLALLSGGTDGEDGPTDAAGALIDADVVRAMRQQGLAPHDFLRRNDAYHFFAAVGGLIKTGPTHTNVCDLRVLTVSPD